MDRGIVNYNQVLSQAHYQRSKRIDGMSDMTIELRRRIYRKAKAEKQWRFWGLYVHVCKLETLRVAYQEARANDGAPGLDGVSFEDIESQGVEEYLENIGQELLTRTYKPTKNRRVEIKIYPAEATTAK